MKTFSKSLSKETIKIFWRFTKTEWPMVSLAFACVVIVAILQAYLPFFYKRLIDLMSGGPLPGITGKGAIIIAGIAGVGAMIILLRRAEDLAAIRFQPRVKFRLLTYCYKYLQNHSVNFFNNSFAGSLVRKINRYDRAYEELSDQMIFSIGQTAVRVLFIIIAASFRSWILSLVIVIWVLLFISISYMYARIRMKYDLARAEQDSVVTGFLSDTIGNMLNIKLFSGYGNERKSFGKEVEEQERRLKASWNIGLRADLVNGMLLVILEVAIMYAVFIMWRNGDVSIGDFALFQAYIGHIGGRLWDFGRNVRRIYESFADANEMTEILLTPHEVVDASTNVLEVAKGKIEFKKVFFAYPGASAVFKDFNFSINPGERVALVGPSGGGKSTIVKMLLRFFDINAGVIEIDGQNIATVTQDSLRNNIGLVPQDPALFHRTLYENILYAKPGATKRQVFRAAKLAHCHEFISSFPDGYSTYVGERGVKLSGGERQRVAIARAILKDAPILILDEATSSLDSESERLIQDAMLALMKDKTVIVIAHRLSTIMQMDRIVVLEGGNIVEQGKHSELVKAKQGLYQKLWEIQAGGFTT